VRNRADEVIAALNLGTITARFELKKTAVVAAVKQSANRLSRRLGWIPDRQGSGAANGRR
jgi:DNA-binding IclR family transcriptional regulator